MPTRRSTVNREAALAIARDRFGYGELRAGQREAIELVPAGRDTLAVMPTGAGKSSIYQIPAVVLPGRPWWSPPFSIPLPGPTNRELFTWRHESTRKK
jgi:DEAD/DEAH box helicase